MGPYDGVRSELGAASPPRPARAVRPFMPQHDALGTQAFVAARAGLPPALQVPARVRIAQACGSPFGPIPGRT
ncbi:MAG TPA: hypothetical protein VLT82_07610 [Myxococcaceae bacterium]|nr:hypothetical protein [Myxococcaceae bacterium]